jgi:hypothetical protein
VTNDSNKENDKKTPKFGAWHPFYKILSRKTVPGTTDKMKREKGKIKNE